MMAAFSEFRTRVCFTMNLPVSTGGMPDGTWAVGETGGLKQNILQKSRLPPPHTLVIPDCPKNAQNPIFTNTPQVLCSSVHSATSFPAFQVLFFQSPFSCLIKDITRI